MTINIPAVHLATVTTGFMAGLLFLWRTRKSHVVRLDLYLFESFVFGVRDKKDLSSFSVSDRAIHGT